MRQGASENAEIAQYDDEIAEGSWRSSDPSRRRTGLDPATKKLALIALGVAGVAVLGIGIFSASGHRGGEVPVIQADSRPLRVKPENPGGMQVAGSNDEILSGDAASTSSQLAPPPETPAPNVLRARQQAQAQVQAQAHTQAPSRPASVAPAPVEADPAPVVAVEKPPAPTRAAAHAPAPSGSGKGTLVQLAALSSEDAARAAWVRLSKRLPELLDGRHPSVSRTEVGGKVYWRLRTGGFSGTAQATSFCEQARAKGAACAVASF